jgi:hypothetical protein
MGKLLSLDEDKIDPQWYFKDAYWSGTRQRYVFKWPSDDFPFILYIHDENINNSRRIEIRKYIEEMSSGTVFYELVRKDYRKFYGEESDWSKSYEVDNRWIMFAFENEEDLLSFKLKFPYSTMNATAHNPKYPEDEEYLKNRL